MRTAVSRNWKAAAAVVIRSAPLIRVSGRPTEDVRFAGERPSSIPPLQAPAPRRMLSWTHLKDAPHEATQILLDRNFTIGSLDRRRFRAFVEHLGRGVCGMFEPGHPTANEQRFRRDVLDLVRELGVTDRALPCPRDNTVASRLVAMRLGSFHYLNRCPRQQSARRRRRRVVM